jgi:hypothetical protein
MLGAALGAVHAPRRGCRGDEHLAPDGAGAAQRAKTSAHAETAAGAEVRERGARLGLRDADAAPARLELVGEDDGERRAHALSHLRLADGQRHDAVGIDADPRVRAERRFVVRLRVARAKRERERRPAEERDAEKLAARSHFSLLLAA